MPDVAFLNRRDYGREITTMKVNTTDLTAGNLTAQLALATALVAAADDITRGITANSQLTILTPGTPTPPTDPLAQIETGWLIFYNDTQTFLDPGPDTIPNPGFGKPFQLYWPCADYSGTHLLEGEDFADLVDDADVAAFVAAFEAYVRSPYGGTIAISAIQVSGSDA